MWLHCLKMINKYTQLVQHQAWSDAGNVCCTLNTAITIVYIYLSIWSLASSIYMLCCVSLFILDSFTANTYPSLIMQCTYVRSSSSSAVAMYSISEECPYWSDVESNTLISLTDLRSYFVFSEAMILLSTFILCFGIDTLTRTCILLKGARKKSYWLCVFYAFSITVYGIITMLAYLQLHAWSSIMDCAFSMSFSILLNNLCDAIVGIMLTLKAYCTSGRSRVILGLGFFLSSLHIFYGCHDVFTTAPDVARKRKDCMANFTIASILIKLALELINNGFGTACFVATIHRYAQDDDTRIFSVLRREELTYFSLITLTNIACTCMILWKLFGEDSMILYALNCKYFISRASILLFSLTYTYAIR
jgi:hypothetical protein